MTPFRLSDRCNHIANWSAIANELPAGWDEEEYRILETAYPWCETLAAGCDCHGTSGGLNVVHCSAFGLAGDKEKRASKTRNVRYEHYIRDLEERIAQRDEQFGRRDARQRSGPRLGTQSPPSPTGRGQSSLDPARTLARALGQSTD